MAGSSSQPVTARSELPESSPPSPDPLSPEPLSPPVSGSSSGCCPEGSWVIEHDTVFEPLSRYMVSSRDFSVAFTSYDSFTLAWLPEPEYVLRVAQSTSPSSETKARVQSPLHLTFTNCCPLPEATVGFLIDTSSTSSCVLTISQEVSIRPQAAITAAATFIIELNFIFYPRWP